MKGSGQHTLILLTTHFPFGDGETFLETEIKYLAEAFGEVVIITGGQGEQRSLPPNCKVVPLNFEIALREKRRALRGIFHPMVREEIQVVKKVYQKKITRGVLLTMLFSWHQVLKIEKACEKHLPENAANPVFFYSYWTNEKAHAIALLKQKHQQIKAFSRLHGWDLYFETSGIDYIPFRHFIARHLDRIFSVSEKGKAYCENNWKTADLAKTRVSRLGVENQTPTKLPSNCFTLVSCSNMIPLKRVCLVVEALALVENLHIHWVHFGGGVLLDEVRALAETKLKGNISFDLKGKTPNTEVLDFYRENPVDLFIHLSESEGIPVAIMEAMSFGIPVMATNAGGTPEIVHAENGFLLDVNVSPDQIAQAIAEFAALDEAAKDKLSANALHTQREQYNAAANYPAFISEIKAL